MQPVRSWFVFVLVLGGCDNKDKPKEAPPPQPTPSTPADAAVAVTAPIDATAPALDAPDKPDATAATKAAFPELLDQHKRFVFEIVEGKRIDSLKPLKGAPRVFGTTGDPKLDGDYTKVFLTTRPESGIPMELAQTAKQTLLIVFYEDGIRQLAALGAMADAKDNIRGFTFPNTLDKPVTIEGKPDFGTATINVKRANLDLAGKKHDVMLAETKLVEAAVKSTTYETMAYAPGLGPALLCVADEKGAMMSCLRWVATEDRP